MSDDTDDTDADTSTPYDTRKHNIKYSKEKLLEISQQGKKLARIIFADAKELEQDAPAAAGKLNQIAQLVSSHAHSIEAIATLGLPT